MKKISRSVCLLLFIAAFAAAQPTITGLSTANTSRSGLILIRGSGFGVLQGSGRVEVGSVTVTAPLLRWPD
jgi:hypothetical protein